MVIRQLDQTCPFQRRVADVSRGKYSARSEAPAAEKKWGCAPSRAFREGACRGNWGPTGRSRVPRLPGLAPLQAPQSAHREDEEEHREAGPDF